MQFQNQPQKYLSIMLTQKSLSEENLFEKPFGTRKKNIVFILPTLGKLHTKCLFNTHANPNILAAVPEMNVTSNVIQPSNPPPQTHPRARRLSVWIAAHA